MTNKIIYKKYARPMMLRSIINSLMHTADRLIAALFIGASALVATTITSPLMYLSYAVAALFIGGLGAYVGLLIGRNKIHRANQAASGILVLMLLIGLVLTGLGYAFHKNLVIWLGAKGQMVEMTRTYLMIFVWSFPFMLVGRGMDVLICNDDSPRYSFILNMVTTSMNLILNILAVSVLNLGIGGLAMATVISEGVLCLGGLYYFVFKSKKIKLQAPKLDITILKRIMFNGLSDFSMLLVDAVMVFVINRAFVAFLTPMHFEAYAAANILMVLFYGIFMGASTGLQPIFSRWMGMKKNHELKALLSYSIKRSMVIGVLVYLLSLPVVSFILALFVDLESTLSLAKFFYMTMGFAVLFSNLPLQASIFFTAINRPIESALISVLRTLIFIPIIAYLAIMYLGPVGLSLGYFLSDMILIGLLVVYLKRLDLSQLVVLD